MPGVAERPCIDSNILVYAVAGHGTKRAVALDVVGRGGVISVQALGETAYVLRRKAGLSLDEIGTALAILRGFADRRHHGIFGLGCNDAGCRDGSGL